jgi:hypothetical protein
MNNPQKIFDLIIIISLLLLCIDATICGYFGLTTGKSEKMPRFVSRSLMYRLELASEKHKELYKKNKLYDLLISFFAVSLYLIIGGIQIFSYLLRYLLAIINN